MKNYVFIALALLAGCLVASLGCAPVEHQQPTHRVLVLNLQGEVARTYQATGIWSINSNQITFTDAQTGGLAIITGTPVIVEPLPQHDFRSWPVTGEELTGTKTRKGGM